MSQYTILYSFLLPTICAICEFSGYPEVTESLFAVHCDFEAKAREWAQLKTFGWITKDVSGDGANPTVTRVKREAKENPMETIIGVFASRDRAEETVKELLNKQVPQDAIVFLTRSESEAMTLESLLAPLQEVWWAERPG